MFFIIEIISWGTEVLKHAQNAIGETIVFKYGWVLLSYYNSKPTKKLIEEWKMDIYSNFPQMKNNLNTKEVVDFIMHDNFNPNTLDLTNNNKYWGILGELKGKLIHFYTTNFCESSNGAPFYQYHSEFNQMVQQLKKLRMVIEPEFHIIKNVHPTSKIPYFSVRGFWLDENGKKVKVFTKSLGREDKYINGKNDESLLEEARVQIQQLASLKYKEEFN